MNKEILFMVAIVIIIMVLFELNKSFEKSADACSGAPFLDKSKCNQMNSWLDQKLAEWKPAAYHPMAFGALFPPLSYGGEIYQDDTKFSDTYLSFLDELKLDIMRIDLYYDIWLNKDTRHIAVVDEIIKHIREKNYKLMIADSSAEQYQRKYMSWDGFSAAYLNRVETLTERYKPEYYVIVKEITWYDKIGNLKSTPTTEQWANLTRELAKTLKRISPETLVAVGFVPQDEKEYFYRVLEIEEVDIVGFDIYDKDWSLPASGELAVLAKNKGKEAWVLETWLHYLPSTGKPWKKELDAKWINATAYYAQRNNLDGYMTFFTRHFFSYSDKQIEGFTPAFYAYKSVIEEVKNSVR